MAYQVVMTARAKRDRKGCFDFIAQRSLEGAERWLQSFEDATAALFADPHYGESPESLNQDETIRQKMFKTRHGRTYRILYVLRRDKIYILHVRGPGQDLMLDHEITLPDDPE